MRLLGSVLVLIVGVGFGCKPFVHDPFFTEDEWAEIKTLSPLPDAPIDTTNKYEENPAAIALGQKFFFEQSFQQYGLKIGVNGCQQANDPNFPSVATPPVGPPTNPANLLFPYPPAPATFKNGVGAYLPPSGDLACSNSNAKGVVGQQGVVQCNSCHIAATWFNDNGPSNVSVAVTYSFRNDPSLVNSAFYTLMGWGGTGENPWIQAITTIEGGQELTERLGTAHVIYQKYRSEYEAIFVPDYPALPTELGATGANWGTAGSPDPTGRFPMQGRPGNTAGFGAEVDAKGVLSTKDPIIAGWISAWNSMITRDPVQGPIDQDTINRIEVNMNKALGAYIRSLASRNSRFDQEVNGHYAAMSDQEKNGLKLFITKASCVSCHNGPFFSDNGYHAVAVPKMPQVGEGNGHFGTITGFATVANYLNGSLFVPNNLPPGSPPSSTPLGPPTPSNIAPAYWSGMGAYSDDPEAGKQKLIDNHLINKDGTPILNPPKDQLGRYRTKTLRQVQMTGPYMHNGYFQTLWQVVDFYNNGGGIFTDENTAAVAAVPGQNPAYTRTDYQIDGNLEPLGLTGQEEDDLVSFLLTLTGDPIPAALSSDSRCAKGVAGGSPQGGRVAASGGCP